MPTQQPGSDPTATRQKQGGVTSDLVDEAFTRPETPHIETSLEERRRSRAGAAKAKIAQLAEKASAQVDQASAAASELNSRAAAAYERARASARNVQQRVDPLVHERPYAAIGIAACAGLFLGLLLGRGPKVIYLRSRD